jgi:hypothetical protein
MSIKPTLKFLDNGDDVIPEKWRPWKKRHHWTCPTWDFLLSHPTKDYFVKWLRLEGWHKRLQRLCDGLPGGAPHVHEVHDIEVPYFGTNWRSLNQRS